MKQWYHSGIETWKDFQKKSVFSSTLGISFAIILLMVLFGTPESVYADTSDTIGSWIGGLVSNAADASLGTLFEGIAYILLSFCDFILYLVGTLFNYTVQETVFAFGSGIGSSPGIITAWKVLRDVSNIGLLFGFIFLGIATMLDIHGYEVKKTLPRLLIVAVLLNFSLLVSQGIIDTANIFASVLYSQAGSACATNQTNDQCAKDDGGISGRVFSMSGLSTIFSGKGANIGGGGSGDPSGAGETVTSNTTWGIVYLGMAIFVIITAVVLLAGAILLIIRAVMLCILMALAPIGFAGMAIPPLEKYAKMWWDKLLSQSFFAPVYLLLIFVGLKIAEGIRGSSQLSGAATESFVGALAVGSSGSIGILLIFSLMIGFMVAALLVAKQMGAMGADFAISASRKVISYPFALAHRNGVAPMSNYVLRRYNEYVGGLDEGGSGGKKFAAILRTTGIDEGVAATFGAARKAKVGGFASYDDRQKEIAARKNETTHAAEIGALRDAISKAAAPDADESAQKAAQAIAQKLNMHGLEEAIKTMSAAQVEKLGEVLSPERFQEIMKNKDITADKQELMTHGRFGKFNADDDNTLAQVKNLTKEDQEQFAKAFGERFDQLLEKQRKGQKIFKEDQLDVLKDSKVLTATQRSEVKRSTLVGRVEKLAEVPLNDSPDASDARNNEAYQIITKERMNAEQKAKLSDAALKMSGVRDTFDQKDIQALVDNKKNALTGEEMANLATYARGEGGQATRDPDHGARMKAVNDAFNSNEFLRGAFGQKKTN